MAWDKRRPLSAVRVAQPGDQRLSSRVLSPVALSAVCSIGNAAAGDADGAAKGVGRMEAASQQPRSLVAKPGGALLAGLTDEEAAARRARGEGNVAPPATGRSYWQILRENLFTFINITLFGLGFTLALLGRWLDAIVSTCVILTNVVVSVVQEVRAKQTLDKIALLTRPQATLIRSGQEREAPPDEIVIGDMLKVGPGDQIVVDGKVVGDGRMSVDESQLTGEVESDREAERATPSTRAASASAAAAYYVAEKVGTQSLANQITAGARAFRRVLTPLQGQINLVIRIVLLIVVYFELLMVDELLPQAHQPGAERGELGDHREPRAERSVPLDRGGLRDRRGAHHPLRRAGAAVQRHRVAEQRGRALHGQDRHADGQPPAAEQRAAVRWAMRRTCGASSA